MYHMLPYYAGVYAYSDPNLTPGWPGNDPEFMDAWNKKNLGEWEGKAGQEPVKTRDFTWQDLATIDNEVRDTAIKWIQDHANDEQPFFIDINFMKGHNPNFPSPDVEGQVARPPPLSRLARGPRRQQRPGGAGRSATSASPRTPSSSGRPTTAPGSMPGPMPATPPSAA